MAAERVICVSNKMLSGGPVRFISSPAQRYASDVFCLLETFTKNHINLRTYLSNVKIKISVVPFKWDNIIDYT